MDLHSAVLKTFVTLIIVNSVVTYELTLLHTNDVHARFEQHNVKGGACKPQDAAANKCFGGVARRMSKLKEIRSSEPNTILVDGGDQFQGTMWFYQYRGMAAAHFMNKLEYDVMAIGNHEFDKGVNGLVPFLEKVNFSVVSCNIDTSAAPQMESLFEKSVVKIIGGEKIGVVGYTTTDTKILSNPAPAKFTDEVEAVQAEVQKLVSQGVNKIIAVGHAGFAKDREIAMKVKGVDIVVGGHTNTFLYSGEPPSIEVPAGRYPTVVTQDGGDKVLVVQDYTFGKYLGYLKVTFDDQGNVETYSGNPILLDSSVPQDNETLKEINAWSGLVKNASSGVVGRSFVYLDGEREHCRLKECNLGNLVADAFVHQNLKHLDGMEWSDVSIALINSGSVRVPIDKGEITIGDVKTASPFDNEVNIIEISGRTLRGALEHGVSTYNVEQPAGAFLQVSGLRVVYNLTKPAQKRVVSVHTLCTACSVPQYVPLNSSQVYKVIVSGYIAGGGDGFEVLKKNTLKTHYQGDIDSELILDYIKAVSPVYPAVEGRITFVTGDPCPSDVSGSAILKISYSVFVNVILLFSVLV